MMQKMLTAGRGTCLEPQTLSAAAAVPVAAAADGHAVAGEGPTQQVKYQRLEAHGMSF